MDKLQAKVKRREILTDINAWEKKRCENCNTSTLNTAMVHCHCPAAVEIRRLGVDYEKVTTATRQGRLDDSIEEMKRNGLTPELYKYFREMEFSIKAIQEMVGLKKWEFDEWRYDNGFSKRPAPSKPESQKRPAVDPEQSGLTPKVYKDAKRIGYSDVEICKNYKISKIGLYKFKKKYNLALPRGQHSKYPNHKKAVGGN